MKKKIVILGGGLSGLACGYNLFQNNNNDFLILEKENLYGGLCKSFNINNYIFDYTGHLLHTSQKKTTDFIKSILKNNIVKNKRNAVIYFDNKFIDYPFQTNLDQLSTKKQKKAFINFLNKKNIKINNFKDWSYSNYGKTITDYFIKPYNEKLYSTELKNISTDWFGNIMPTPDQKKILQSFYGIKNKNIGYNSSFYYPKKNGIGDLINKIGIKIKKNILLNTKIKKIDLKNKTIITNNNIIKYDYLINTIPLPELLKIINQKHLINKLDWVSVYNLNIGVESNLINKFHWTYIPNKNIPFYRIGCYHNFSKFMVPNKNKLSFYTEVSYKTKLKTNKNTLNKKIINDIKKIFFKNINFKIDVKFPLDIKYAYVVYNNNYKKIVPEIFKNLKKHNIFSIGRYSEWKYSTMEYSILKSQQIIKDIQ